MLKGNIVIVLCVINEGVLVDEESLEVFFFSVKTFVFLIFPREIYLFYLLSLHGNSKIFIYTFLNENSATYLMNPKLEIYGVGRYSG